MKNKVSINLVPKKAIKTRVLMAFLGFILRGPFFSKKNLGYL
jgi:hypothetical protein